MTDITKLSSKKLAKYLEEQLEFMNIINSRAVLAGRKPVFDEPRSSVLTTEIVRTDGGFRIVKRANPIDLVDIDEHNRSASATVRTYSDRVFAAPKGKYNDEDKLFGQDYGTAEVGEVRAWATI